MRTRESNESALHRNYVANTTALQNLKVIDCLGRPISGGMPLPDLDELAEGFSSTKLLNAALLFRGGVGTVLVPHREEPQDTFAALVYVVQQTIPQGALVNKPNCGKAKPTKAAQEPVTSWQLIYGENAPEMEKIHEGDDLSKAWGVRLQIRSSLLSQNPGLVGTDPITYAAGLVAHLGNNTIPDQEYWTLWDAGSANTSSKVSYAGWRHNGLHFLAGAPEIQHSDSRLRLWLKGSIIS